MNATELDVLRALLRLARRRTPPSLEALVVRVGVEELEVRNALRVLAWQGLVQRTDAGLGLSMQGLAVAVAYAKRPIVSTTKRPEKRVEKRTEKRAEKRVEKRAA